MKNNTEKGRVLYDIDEGIIKKYRDNPPRLQLSNDIIPTELSASTRLQSPKGLNSSDSNESIINNSIPQQNKNVKGDTITNNYIQENQNYVSPISEQAKMQNVFYHYLKQHNSKTQ